MVLLSFLLMPCIIAGAGFHDSAGVIAVRDVAGSLMLRVFPDVASVPVAANVSAVAFRPCFSSCSSTPAFSQARNHKPTESGTYKHAPLFRARKHSQLQALPNVPTIPHWPLPPVRDLTRDGRWITYASCPMFHPGENAHAWEKL